MNNKLKNQMASNSKNKHWNKTSSSKYQLMVNDTEVVTLDMISRKKGVIVINGQTFTIHRKSQMSRIFQVLNHKNHLIAEAKPKKWYSSQVIFRYQNREYLIKTRNNPLVEIVMQDLDKQDLLAYGIEMNKTQKNIRVTDNRRQNQDYLPDAILWFLFESIPSADFLEDMLF